MDDEKRPMRYDADIANKALELAAEQVALKKAQRDFVMGKKTEEVKDGEAE